MLCQSSSQTLAAWQLYHNYSQIIFVVFYSLEITGTILQPAASVAM